MDLAKRLNASLSHSQQAKDSPQGGAIGTEGTIYFFLSVKGVEREETGI